MTWSKNPLCRGTIIHLVYGNLKGMVTCQVAQPGCALCKCLVEAPLLQPRSLGYMMVRWLIIGPLFWLRTSTIGGSKWTWFMMWVLPMLKFTLMGCSNTTELAVEPILTTSSLGFTHRMILPTTWNLVGRISKFLKNSVCFHCI